MKSIIKILGLLLLTVFTLVNTRSHNSKARKNVKSKRSNNMYKTSKSNQTIQPNYVTSKAKVKYDYSKIDPTYKNEALKNVHTDSREIQLYKHTIEKVLKIYNVDPSAIDVCFKALRYPKTMHLMLLTFTDRSNDNTTDEFFMQNVKAYPPACLEPLKKMKDELPKKVNELKDAVYQFKHVQRRLRKLRKARENADPKCKKNQHLENHKCVKNRN